MSRHTANTITIREYLAKHHLNFQATSCLTAKATDYTDYYAVDTVIKWEDFDRRKVDLLFGSILDAQIQASSLPNPPKLLEEQLQIVDERSFESILLAHTTHVINAALVAGVKMWNELKKESRQPVLWMSGSYFKCPPFKPDWGAMRKESTPNKSLVCGDTKYITIQIKIAYHSASFTSSLDKSPTQKQPHSDLNPNSSVSRSSMSTAAKEGLRFNRQVGHNRHLSSSLSPSPRSSSSRPKVSPNRPQNKMAGSLSQIEDKLSCFHGETWDEKILDSWLSQVNSYAVENNTKYCYIISPYSIIVGRRYIDEGSPATAYKPSRKSERQQDAKQGQEKGQLQQESSPVRTQSLRERGSPMSPRSRRGGGGGRGGRGATTSSPPPPPSSPPFFSQSSSDSSYMPNPTDTAGDASLAIAEVLWVPKTKDAKDLNVNLALWTLHMLTAVRETDVLSSYGEGL
ncbi:hypothetical protein BKA65DRAFT_483455 [Rhexocercosporidium sp. MPI-PUGE-AT-0058]|nr:hypothetical protein BKA65DRAFT_483455 [Rhexocercosporidium sp. MPI-PUGE-AT-0058]